MTGINPRTAQRHRKAAGLAAPVGAPATLDDAKRTLVMLDATSREIARMAGAGNVSAGIRLALRHWGESKK